MAFENVTKSTPVKRKDGKYVFTAFVTDEPNDLYEGIVASGNSATALDNALKSLCDKRNKAGVACFCGFKPVQTKGG